MHIHVKTRPIYNYAHPIDMEKENCNIVTNLIDWLIGSVSTETKAVLKSKYVIITTVASTCTVCFDNPVQCAPKVFACAQHCSVTKQLLGQHTIPDPSPHPENLISEQNCIIIFTARWLRNRIANEVIIR